MTDTETTPALADPPMHQCPRPGSAIMPCCGRTPFEVPRVDGLTTEQYLVTCGELTDEDWQVWHAIHSRRLGLELIGSRWYSPSFLRRCFCSECEDLLEQLNATRAQFEDGDDER